MKKAYVFLALFCVALFIVFGYFYRAVFFTNAQFDAAPVVVTDALDRALPTLLPGEPNITGTFLMSLVQKNADPNLKGFIVPRAYTLGGLGTAFSEMHYTGIQQRAGDKSLLTLQHSLSANKQRSVFLGMPLVDALEDSVSVGRRLQIFTHELLPSDTKEVSLIKIRDSEQITHDSYEGKMSPSINNRGDVVYQASSASANKNNLPIYDAESASVYLVHGGSTLKIDDGIKPKWLSTAAFIYIRNDGVYVYNVESKEKVLVIPNNTTLAGKMSPFQNNAALAVSKDGSLFVFSDPNSRSIELYRVDSWFLPKPVLVGYVEDVLGFWPLISPDRSLISVQTANEADTVHNPQPRLLFFVVPDAAHEGSSMKRHSYSLDLDQYVQDQMFIDDWISN
jgi:hypothetical protein